MGPLTPGDLLRSVGLVSVPAGEERELLHNEHTGAARLLTYEDGDILGLCRSFRSAADHARAICRDAGLPESAAPALTSQISLFARWGLLLRRSDVLSLLPHRAPPPAESLPSVRAEGTTVGERLNTALLANRGRRFLFDDRPVRGAAAAPPAFGFRADFLRSGDAPPGVSIDPAGLLGAAPADLATEDVDLDSLDARFLRTLKRGDGWIAVTQAGTRGRFVDRLVVTTQPLALDGPLGLDHRRLLPPAPDVDAGARDVFLLVLRKMWDPALIALLPGVADGGPAADLGLAEILLALIGPFEIGPARPGGGPRLHAIAEHLRAAASLEAGEFRRLVLPLLLQAGSPERRAAALDADFPDHREAILAYARRLETWP